MLHLCTLGPSCMALLWAYQVWAFHLRCVDLHKIVKRQAEEHGQCNAQGSSNNGASDQCQMHVYHHNMHRCTFCRTQCRDMYPFNPSCMCWPCMSSRLPVQLAIHPVHEDNSPAAADQGSSNSRSCRKRSSCHTKSCEQAYKLTVYAVNSSVLFPMPASRRWGFSCNGTMLVSSRVARK
jgi:hypothetical protein